MQSSDLSPEILVYPFLHPLHQFIEQDQTYLVRHIPWQDTSRQDEYQRLRAETFVRQLGWDVPIDSSGREHDRYDRELDATINVHCVSGISRSGKEHLLAGVRVFQLDSWQDSMIMN